MGSISFRDHNGQLLELACYKFAPPEGYTHADAITELTERWVHTIGPIPATR